MKIDEIKLLYDYNDWADARFLAACARVSPGRPSSASPKNFCIPSNGTSLSDAGPSSARETR